MKLKNNIIHAYQDIWSNAIVSIYKILVSINMIITPFPAGTGSFNQTTIAHCSHQCFHKESQHKSYQQSNSIFHYIYIYIYIFFLII